MKYSISNKQPNVVDRRLFGSLNKSNSGQALLLILLVMAVSLTVVLSSFSKTVSDVATTTLEEDSLRAFSAAEAGIEQALILNNAGSVNDPNFDPHTGASFDAVVSTNSTGSSYVYPKNLFSGEVATFWFVNHDSDGNLTCAGGKCLATQRMYVCWGKSGTSPNNSSTPAIELSIYHDSDNTFPVTKGGGFSSVEVERLVFDPNSARASGNGFTDVSAQPCPVSGYAFSTKSTVISSSYISLSGGDINVNYWNMPGGLLMARVRMIYNDTSSESHPVIIGVAPFLSSQLSPQGIEIESTGISGDSTRKINVFRSFPEPPFIFDSAIYSRQDITKI